MAFKGVVLKDASVFQQHNQQVNSLSLGQPRQIQRDLDQMLGNPVKFQIIL